MCSTDVIYNSKHRDASEREIAYMIITKAAPTARQKCTCRSSSSSSLHCRSADCKYALACIINIMHETDSISFQGESVLMLLLLLPALLRFYITS